MTASHNLTGRFVLSEIKFFNNDALFQQSVRCVFNGGGGVWVVGFDKETEREFSQIFFV